jgi:hypothetical protein
MEKNKYEAKYYYCYCTKSSHFEFIMNDFKNNIHLFADKFDGWKKNKQKYLCDM